MAADISHVRGEHLAAERREERRDVGHARGEGVFGPGFDDGNLPVVADDLAVPSLLDGALREKDQVVGTEQTNQVGEAVRAIVPLKRSLIDLSRLIDR